ncbi:uncharacterized protein LOC143508667 [Brachyhypopomus gauderio]|uniref:uncharacterized protein LOC143508667 n=1 Tax=Brachyhypopomus gauderio TaxID=698409 RepID=UPI004042600E
MQVDCSGLCECFLSMVALDMDLQDISQEFVRTILQLAEEIESGAAAPDSVTDQIHDFIEVLGLLSALSHQNIDYRVIANFEEVLQRFSIQPQQTTAGPGRPAFHIPSGMLEHHVLCGVTAPEIADMYGVSERTIRRHMEQNGIRKTDLYSPLTNEELDYIVTDVHRSHPNTGYKLMHGLLKARGIRVPISRLRESFRRVDAEGVCMRRLRLHTLRRRQYSVPGPNYLWHIDDGGLWSMEEWMDSVAWWFTLLWLAITEQTQSYRAFSQLLMSMDCHQGYDLIKVGRMQTLQNL